MLFPFPFYNNLKKEEKLNCKMFIRFQIIISLQDLCLIVFALKNIEIYGLHTEYETPKTISFKSL